MPHRDPDTGQFLGGDHAGAVAAADDVLEMRAEVKVGDGSVTDTDFEPPTTVDGHKSLEIQKDYRILLLEVFLWSRPHNADVATDTPDADHSQQNVQWQLATTGTHAETPPPSEGGATPDGVLYQHHTVAATDIVWDVTGTDANRAAVRPGYGERFTEVVPAEKITNASVTPDAGTAINLHLEVAGNADNADSSQHWMESRFYVQERTQ